jgi:hypothetical protein
MRFQCKGLAKLANYYNNTKALRLLEAKELLPLLRIWAKAAL